MKINYDSSKEIKEVLEKEGMVKLDQFFQEPYFHFSVELEDVPMSHKYKTGKPIQLHIPFLKDLVGKEDFSFVPIVMEHTDFSMAVEDSDGYDIIIDMTKDWPPKAGGAIVYGDQIIPPAFNSLTIVKKGVSYFQYCNHYATKRVFLISR